MVIINKSDIENFEPPYRTAFINSLAGFRQAVLVGTQSAEGFTNLAVFNSLIHLGANPSLFGLISRPGVVERHTWQNIVQTKEYTLNFVPAKDYKKAHQTSARYPRHVSEFGAAGFEAEFHSSSNAPFVKEAIVKIAMKLEDTIPIPLNGTLMMVGSVVQVHIDDALIGTDGFVDLSAANVLISQGLDAYFVSTPLGRLPYAQP